MIHQMISHTPLYVWALLAFLVYRGVLASRDREAPLLKLAIIPVVMLVLSLSGLPAQGPLGAGVWAVWGVGMLAGAWAQVTLAIRRGHGEIQVNRSAGTIVQRGSWAPLVLMLAIFVTKYAVAVVTATQPALVHELSFAVGITLLFGVFNGVFLGRLARQGLAWLRTAPAVLA